MGGYIFLSFSFLLPSFPPASPPSLLPLYKWIFSSNWHNFTAVFFLLKIYLSILLGEERGGEEGERLKRLCLRVIYTSPVFLGSSFQNDLTACPLTVVRGGVGKIWLRGQDRASPVCWMAHRLAIILAPATMPLTRQNRKKTTQVTLYKRLTTWLVSSQTLKSVTHSKLLQHLPLRPWLNCISWVSYSAEYEKQPQHNLLTISDYVFLSIGSVTMSYIAHWSEVW